VTVLKFSLPVLLLDELLKFVARNYADGKGTGMSGKKQYYELGALVFVFLAYGFAWYRSEIAIMDSIAAALKRSTSKL
jgi:Ca2+ transporting ATPase